MKYLSCHARGVQMDYPRGLVVGIFIRGGGCSLLTGCAAVGSILNIKCIDGKFLLTFSGLYLIDI
jgi:hypothetical protein